MLQELCVENLLLIERARLRLAGGLNVLTGETGAGKTVLAHALDLLLGGRARQGIVRPGASEAYVEGTFELTEAMRERLGERLSADAREVVLARRVGEDGRTRAYLNGRTATVGDLREIGAALVSFHGQHEHRTLTLAETQLRILDGCCGEEHADLLAGCAAAHERVRALERRRRELAELAGGRERELDLLRFELGEIDEVDPSESEHERLLGARERLRRLDALLAAAAAGAEALDPADGEAPGAVGLIAAAVAATEACAGVDGRLDGLAERLRALAIESQDVAGELRGYCEGTGRDGEELSLEGAEERLAAIERLMRKHGGSVAAVLDYAEQARARADELSGAEEELGGLDGELDAARARLSELVAAIGRARRDAAGPFAEAVREQLASLAMGQAHFEVALGEREPGPSGGDAVEFLIAPNPGVPPAPLREVASGGELSRTMLAIMSVAGAGDPDVTLVFDEVDAGIGGHTARAVGARLKELSRRGQVLCITHLPQIASLGERHFSIVKDTAAQLTRTSVVELAEGEVIGELVRMLGADSDDSAARRHARDLRKAA